MFEIQNSNYKNALPDYAVAFREFGFLSFEFVSDFDIRISDFRQLALHISNRREPYDRPADSGELGRFDHFVDVFVSRTGFFREARP
jgi:hypothetical protein